MSKRKKTRSAAFRGDFDCIVRKAGDGWAVLQGRRAQPSSVHKTQTEAETAAREMVRIAGGTVRIQGRNGRWHESFTLGREGFARISAVEKVFLTREMRRDFRDFDRKALSAEQRRTRIVSKYGRTPT
jgi:hypothetical protein